MNTVGNITNSLQVAREYADGPNHAISIRQLCDVVEAMWATMKAPKPYGQGSDPEFPTDELALRCAPEDPKRIPSLQHIWRKDARIGAKCICGAKVLMTAESTTPKPLTLADLKQQVEEVSLWKHFGTLNDLTKKDEIWVIGEFEIRRRK